MNTLWAAAQDCRTCGSRISGQLLRRPDGSWMDPTIYCETCDSLEPLADQVELNQEQPSPQGASIVSPD